MRIRNIAAGLVAAAALLTGGLALATPATAGTTSAPVTLRPCQVLRTLPGYSYRTQGATVTEPTGAVRYREIVSDGVSGTALQSACRTVATEQVRHNGAPAPVLAVWREVGIR